jgi:branched-chain amino acid aminotransferase
LSSAEKSYSYLNGKLVPEGEARVSVLDRGFLYGDSVFETLRAYAGRPFMLGKHLDRLFRSAAVLGIRIPLDRQAVADAISRTLEANSLSEAVVRVTVSRGKGPPGIDPGDATVPTFVVHARPFVPYPDEIYSKGAALVIAGVRRTPPEALDPSVKHGNFLNNIIAKGEASRAGAHDAIMLNTRGEVSECSVSNIFFVREGVLCTPSKETGMLAGVTREVVAGLALKEGMEVREGLFRPEELMGAGEVFLTGTTIEVLPVSRVGETVFGPGPVTSRLRESFKTFVARGQWE